MSGFRAFICSASQCFASFCIWYLLIVFEYSLLKRVWCAFWPSHVSNLLWRPDLIGEANPEGWSHKVSRGGWIKLYLFDHIGTHVTILKISAQYDAADSHYAHSTLEFRSVMALLRQRPQCRQLRLPGWDNGCLSPFYPFLLVFLVLLKHVESCP